MRHIICLEIVKIDGNLLEILGIFFENLWDIDVTLVQIKVLGIIRLS